MEAQLMRDGVELLVYGMGVVFGFLILLVFATSQMSRLVRQYLPEPEPGRGLPESTEVDGLTLKIIQAAVDRHRGRK